MAKAPKTTGEHIIALYGHITGLKKELSTIKNNHLKHMHEDIDKLGGKIDKIYWVLLAAVGAVAIMLLGKII
jgi:hypothetical protein|tara:strand:- start:4031 stop:4246 length:216 start_codon:yes stop_codon:yes gene_type:complete